MENQKRKIVRKARIDLAKEYFWSYCRFTLPTFYKEDRPHLKKICETLQALYEKRIRKKKNGIWVLFPRGKDIPEEYEIVCKNIILNAPPRHGKTVTVQKFCEWMLGKNQENRVITISYNDLLSSRLSKQVRDSIEYKTIKDLQITFNDVFPEVGIKRGDSAKKMWALDGQYFNYLGGSPKGTITGVGCNIGVIDDLVKNKYEAFNELILDDHWDFYINTYLSRLEEGAMQIVVMTRWSSRDLCGRLIDKYKNKWFTLSMRAYDENKEKMLCEPILSLESFEEKKGIISPEIINANYQQEPMDLKGRLYKSFKLYDFEEIKKDAYGRPMFDKIICRIDTADEGDDFLCAIAFGVYNKLGYIIDIYFSDEGMEVTELETANFINRNKVDFCIVESNNGGKGFTRNVKRLCREKGNLHTIFHWYHESLNKIARIISNSFSVMTKMIFPSNWHLLFPEFYNAIINYQKEGKNKHDDACFVAGTLIATIKGELPIEEIKIGDLVLTPYGFRKVLNSECTGEKEVIENVGLIGTSKHKVFNGKYFKSLDELTGYTETVNIKIWKIIKMRYQKLLYLMESNIDLWEGRESIILASQIQIKSVLKDFMLRFGSFIIKLKFQKATLFIIKILILIIMTFITLSYYHVRNMLKNINGVLQRNTWKKLGKKLLNGIRAKKVLIGIKNMQKNVLKRKKTNFIYVLNVVRNIIQFNLGVYIVQTYVEKEIEEKKGNKYQSKKNVSFVEKILTLNHTKKYQKNINLKHAQKYVPINLTIKTEKVYNITVEKDGVYYANGILVSNCDCLTGCVEYIEGRTSVQIGGEILKKQVQNLNNR